MISFVIPAHNEQALIGATIGALRAAAAALDLRFEIVVVDDDSTDRTADLAREAGARVVPVQVRQIAGARNAGARASTGDVLIFVDADTIVPLEVLREAMDCLAAGVIAGGAPARLDDDAPLWARVSWYPMQHGARLLRLAGGAFMFMTRTAFEKAGGFDERYFAGEEIHFARALKKVGRFQVLRHPIVTSSRKFRLLGFRRNAREWLMLALRGRSNLRRRENLGLWYDKHRD